MDWIRHYMTKFAGDIHVIFYENLKENSIDELVRLNKFLGLPLDKRRLCCTAVSSTQKSFKRKVRDQNITQ